MLLLLNLAGCDCCAIIAAGRPACLSKRSYTLQGRHGRLAVPEEADLPGSCGRLDVSDPSAKASVVKESKLKGDVKLQELETKQARTLFLIAPACACAAQSLQDDGGLEISVHWNISTFIMQKCTVSYLGQDKTSELWLPSHAEEWSGQDSGAAAGAGVCGQQGWHQGAHVHHLQEGHQAGRLQPHSFVWLRRQARALWGVEGFVQPISFIVAGSQQ